MQDDLRLTVIDQVGDVLRSDRRILGLVLIGSGASGFRDEWSDVDLIAVVGEGHDHFAVGDELSEAIRHALRVDWYIQAAPARALGLRTLLLQGHLELDLSFQTITKLRAVTSRWRIVFDTNGEVQEAMAPPPPAVDVAAELEFRHVAACGNFWFGVKALRRGELLHATTRLGELRSDLTALFSLQQTGTARNAAQEADSLPEEAVAELHALAAPAEPEALLAAFAHALQALRRAEDSLRRAGVTTYCGLVDWLAEKHLAFLDSGGR